MKKIAGSLAIQQRFEELFAQVREEMFKAEVLQDYSTIDDSPSLRAWLNGDKALAIKLGMEDQSRVAWRQQCLASPTGITRVHVVDEPLTPYLEWEIEVLYKNSLVASGAEKVYLVPSSRLKDVQLPAGDFWIFDNAHVLQWTLESESGELIGGQIWERGDDISYFLELKQKLLVHAVPV